jgi:hypothetical protein
MSNIAETQDVVWQSVPKQHLDDWQRIFNASQEGLHLAAACPVCGNHSLHRYFHLAKPEPRLLAGKTFVGRGSGWEWCSSCHSYEHFSGFIPAWWHEALPVDHAKLTALPGALEQALKQQRATNLQREPSVGTRP